MYWWRVTVRGSIKNTPCSIKGYLRERLQDYDRTWRD